MNKDKEIFEKIYEKPEAGWTRHEAPEELSDLIREKQITPCKAIDIGCGEGYYSIYLASMGFEVVGIDLSERAIEYAKKNAEKAGANVRFLAGDVTTALELEERFDFVLGWSVLHHIMPPEREEYIKNIATLLNRGEKYLATCFNEKSLDEAEGEGKYQTSPVGTKLYYSSQAELTDLYEPWFKIIESKLFSFEAPPGVSHIYNCFFMERV